MEEEPEARTLQVGKHTRTIKARPVTYRCEWCGGEATELRMPGPTPRYHPTCKAAAQGAMAYGRVKRMRERQAEANLIPKRPVGRPQKS